MSGRFMTLPFLIAAIGLARFVGQHQMGFALALPAILILTLVGANAPIRSDSGYGTPAQKELSWTGVADERAQYYAYTGLLRENPEQSPDLSQPAREARQVVEAGQEVAVRGTLGLFGYYVGRSVHVIDRTGLVDPLLARLPPAVETDWRIGHLDRELPVGYIETLDTGAIQIESDSLAQYYGHLRLITRGPLFDSERVVTILRFNLGLYDHLLDEYLASKLE